MTNIVFACSANVEISFCPSEGVPEALRGQKHVVSGIEEGDGVYTVHLGHGEYFRFTPNGEVSRFAAGSSVNMLRAFTSLGIPKNSDGNTPKMFVVMPLDSESPNGSFLVKAVREMGGEPVVILADRTPITLALRERGETTLFCVKPGYHFEPEKVENLLPAQIDFAVLTGIKAEDIPLSRLIRGRANLFAVMPHRSVLSKESSMRSMLLEVTSRAVLMQVNEAEAEVLCGDTITRANVSRILTDLGVRRLVVTHGENGASLYVDHQAFQNGSGVRNPVDTVGAGDAHFASLLYFRHFAHPPLQDDVQILEMAGKVAAISVMNHGPCFGIPRAGEIAVPGVFWEQGM